MNEKQGRIQIRVDAYTRVCLTVIACLLTVLIIGLWADRGPSARDAHAADKPIAYVGAQRQAMIRAAEGIEQNTEAMKKLTRLFETGEAKVQVMEPAGQKGGANAPARSGK